jgi:hypothetical protein
MRSTKKVVHLQVSSDRLAAILQTKHRIESQGEKLRWLQDPRGYIKDVNQHIQHLFTVTRAAGEIQDWEVLTPVAFQRIASGLIPPLQRELLWRDMVNQARSYSVLVAFRADSLLNSFIRALNSKDVISPSILGRALLEHTATVYTNAQQILSVFERVGAEKIPVVIPEEQSLKLEETLVRAIWGTRIGRGTDSKKRPIWESTPYYGNSLDATNIMTHLQKLSESKTGMDNSVLKVYEWLSDVVHPATQGYRMFWDDRTLLSEGHTRYTIKREGGADSDYLQAIALWAAGYSCVALRNLLVRVNTSVENMQKHLDVAYSAYRKGLS